MGPALRPTPLSPACGPRRALDAWRLQYCPGWAAIHRPALAPVPVPSGALGMIARTYPKSARRFRDRSFNLGLKQLPHCPEALRKPKRQTGKSDLADFAPSRLHRFETGGGPKASPFPSLHRAASRHRVDPVPKSLLPRRPLEPLSRKGQSPSRCLEDDSPARFGQRRNRPVIHFRLECQWTRVDNSTVRRRV